MMAGVLQLDTIVVTLVCKGVVVSRVFTRVLGVCDM